SACHLQFHEPIRGKGFRYLLRKHGFEVFLIDEHKTFRYCPVCLKETLRAYK
ncbi:hypothetical protein BX666DRAFT_1861150, partial [Dichotomocladium elegans]